MTTTSEYAWSHKGELITLNSNGTFRTSTDAGEETSRSVHSGYESLALAREAIDKVLAARALDAREGVALPALTTAGVACVVTGLRRGSGALLVNPKKSPSGKDMAAKYVDTPAIRALIKRKSDLEDETRRIEGILETVSITGRAYNTYQNNDANYGEAIRLLKENHAKAMILAEAIGKEVA